MRLDKFLTETAGVTRSEAKKKIKEKRVLVNGELAKRPEQQIEEETAQVYLDENRLVYTSLIQILTMLLHILLKVKL